MLSLARRNKIMEILHKKKQIKTQQLEEILGVSGATIRNDLDELESEGFLKRIHGGAVLPEEQFINGNNNSYRNFHYRSQKYVAEKKLIGKEAAKLITSGNTIILDASSTILYLAPFLKEKERLTIITNGLYTALEVKENNDFNIIVLGGIVRCRSGALEGMLGASILSEFTADIMFTSAHGFALDYGLTDFSLYEVELKKRMVAKARKVVALVDHTKLGNISATQFARIEDIDVLITDPQAENKYLKEVEEAGIEVIVAGE